LVFVHELGHFVAAKRGGVNVEEFGFGFPPRLIGKEVGGTVYSLNLIPLGGFVKLQGEDLHDQTPGSFGAASFSRKSAILLAGVSMNALAAFIILVSLCLTGLPPIIANQFSSGQASYVQPKQDMVVNVVKRSPAEQAGIVRGDLILKGNTQNFNDIPNLQAALRSAACPGDRRRYIAAADVGHARSIWRPGGQFVRARQG
jgi:regulator of sigma E protease